MESTKEMDKDEGINKFFLNFFESTNVPLSPNHDSKVESVNNPTLSHNSDSTGPAIEIRMFLYFYMIYGAYFLHCVYLIIA